MPQATRIHEMLMDSLFTDEELKAAGGKPTKFIPVQGITMQIGFHPERLETHRTEVSAALKELDPKFFTSMGGGWSFLNMCVDKDGNQWGEQPVCQELLLMAVGLELATYLLPRDMWAAFPGGVPYIQFVD